MNNLIQLLRDMRVKVERPAVGTYTFQADDIDLEYLQTDEFLRKSASLRGSVMVVGPLVARFGKAMIPKPGGDKIGRRRWIRILSVFRSWVQHLPTIRTGGYMK